MSGLTIGEQRALIASLLDDQPEDLLGFVAVGVKAVSNPGGCPPLAADSKPRCTSVQCTHTSSGHCGNMMCGNYRGDCPVHS